MSSLTELSKKSKDLDGEQPQKKRYRLLKINEVVSRKQVRTSFEELEELANSIKELGVQVPINVRDRDVEGRYVIIQGERRWRAAKQAGLKKIPAIIDESDIDESKRTLMQLTENIQRNDMRPLDIAHAMKKLKDTGMNVTQIGRMLGRSHGYVLAYLSLVDLPKFIADLAESGSIKDATTLQTLKKLYDLKPEEAEAIINAALDENRTMTRATAKSLLAKANQPQTRPTTDAGAETAEQKVPSKPSDPAQAFDAFRAMEWVEEAAGGTAAEGGAKAQDKSEKSKTKPAAHKKPSADKNEEPSSQEETPSAESAPAKQVEATPAAVPAPMPIVKIPAELAGKVKAVAPSQSVRILVDALSVRNGESTVERGYLTPNMVSLDPKMLCVTFESGEVQLISCDNLELAGVEIAPEG